MTHGDLWSVREVSKSQEKWLLVNIQSEGEFKCHELNRDLWNHIDMKDIVRTSFVFWQQLDVSSEGALYCQRYHVQSFPHIAIIDPRTGATIWTYTKAISREPFLERLLDFLGANPYPESAVIGGTKGGKGKTVDVLDLTTASQDEDDGGGGGLAPVSSSGSSSGSSSSSSSSSSSGSSSGSRSVTDGRTQTSQPLLSGFDPTRLPPIAFAPTTTTATTATATTAAATTTADTTPAPAPTTTTTTTTTAVGTVKILFKMPAGLPAARAAPRGQSLSLPVTTSVAVLAAHAAAAVRC